MVETWENPAKSSVVDLTDTEYISSSGLRALLASLKVLKNRGRDLRLISLQPMVRDVFEISGLSNIFSIQRSLDDAVSSLKLKR